MTGRKSFAASAGVTSPVAAIVIVIVVCASAVGIVELQLSSANSGRLDVSTSTVTATVTTTLISISTATIMSSTYPTQVNSAQVSVTAQALLASGFLTGGTAINAVCDVASGTNQMTLSNTGTAAATATSVSITFAGTTTSFAVTAPCTVTAAGLTGATTAGNPINVIFGATNKLTPSAATGGTYTGTVTLSNGAVLLFTGTFQ